MNIQAFPWACVSLALLNPAAHADILLSDAFEYPNGALQTMSSGKWAGHSGTTNQVDVSNGGVNLTGSESQDVNALLAGQPYATTNGPSLYVGFDLKVVALPSGTGSYFAHFKDAGAGFRGRIWALTNGAAPGAFRLGIGSGSGTAPTATHPTDLKPDTDYRIICRLGVSNAVAALWINPNSESDHSVSSDAASGIAVAAFALRQASGIGSMRIDNLVVGTVWADVVASGETALPPSALQIPITVPIITLEPKSQMVGLGADVILTAEVQSAEPLLYQWQFNGANLAGATNAVLSLARVTSEQQGDYRLVARNSSGTVASAVARLTVVVPRQPPRIDAQPVSLDIVLGQEVSFAVSASGTAPLRFQWRFNGKDLPGATTPTLTLPNVELGDAGEYTVAVSNGDGSIESAIATLKVQAPVVVVPPDSFRPPTIRFTNYLANLLRPGDLLTNTFAEHALHPGERLTMEVVVSSADDRPVTLSANTETLPSSARWTFPETTGWNLTARFAFAPTVKEAGSNYVVALNAILPNGANVATWSFYVPTEAEQSVVVSEFLANPATVETAPHFNPLRRAEPAPNPSWQDEFVEIVNASNHEIDLSNWTLSDSASVRHRFPETYGLQAWAAILVYGGPKNGFAPGLNVASMWANAGDSGLGLNNTGVDTISLRNAQGWLIDRVVYSALPTTGAMTRHPTLGDDFVAHAYVSTDPVSPGVNHDGRKFSDRLDAPPAPIVLGAVFGTEAGIVLTWNAATGRSYSVYQAAHLNGEFSAAATGLRFDDRIGRYVVEGPDRSGMRFFRISTP